MVEKQFPDLFQKFRIEHISGSIVQSFIQFVFIACQVEDHQNILKLSCTSLTFTTHKIFLEKQKEA